MTMRGEQNNEADEEAVFEAWRTRILNKEKARTRRISSPRIETGNSGIHFTPEADLASSNGYWSPSGQSMKSRFLDI